MCGPKIHGGPCTWKLNYCCLQYLCGARAALLLLLPHPRLLRYFLARCHCNSALTTAIVEAERAKEHAENSLLFPIASSKNHDANIAAFLRQAACFYASTTPQLTNLGQKMNVPFVMGLPAWPAFALMPARPSCKIFAFLHSPVNSFFPCLYTANICIPTIFLIKLC